MTTIAFRSGVLAADSGVFDAEKPLCFGSMTKIFVLDNGLLYAAAGDVDDRPLRELLGKVDVDAADPMPSGGALLETEVDIDGIVVLPDGRAFHLVVDQQVNKDPHAASGSSMLIEEEYYAVGNGKEVALGSLARGGSAVQAIVDAARHNMYTRLPVQWAHCSEGKVRKE